MNTAFWFSPVVNHLLATSLTQSSPQAGGKWSTHVVLGKPCRNSVHVTPSFCQHISYTIILSAHKLGRDHCLNPRPSHSLNYNILVQREKVSKQMSIFLPNLFLLVLWFKPLLLLSFNLVTHYFLLVEFL